MSEVTETVKQQILEYLKKVKRSVTNKDIARTLKLDKKIVDKAVNMLVSEGKVEWVSFGGETRVKVPEATD
ncbi:MAG: sulfite reductase [Candidatus Caldarchaeales archaeon]